MSTTMATSTNPSKRLAESLAVFSKAAYQAFADVELQSRQEVTQVAAEARAARSERDKALKEINALGFELQSWKQQASSAEAALTQAELTISHQRETISNQVETIAQLKRELSQWKDQSRNWQEHFLRVEQERCAQSSRMDELLLENLQFSRTAATTVPVYTPPKGKHAVDAVSSAPSTIDFKRHSKVISPTGQKPEVDQGPGSDGSHIPRPSKLPANVRKSLNTRPEATQPHATPNGAADFSTSKPKSSRGQPKQQASQAQASQSQSHNKQQPQASTSRPPGPVLIRRVQAVVDVKQESDSEDEVKRESTTAGPSQTQQSSSSRKPKNTSGQASSSTAGAALNGTKKEKQESIERPPLTRQPNDHSRLQSTRPRNGEGRETDAKAAAMTSGATTPAQRKMRPRKAVDYTQDLSASEEEGEEKTRRRRRKAKDISEDEEDEEGKEEGVPRASSTSSKRYRSRPRYVVSDDEDDELPPDLVEDSDEEEDDELMLGAGEEFEEDDHEPPQQTVRAGGGAGRARPSPRKKRRYSLK